jgi:hypothetical protein
MCPIAEVNTPASGSVAFAGSTKHPQGQPIHYKNPQVPTTMQDTSSVFGEMPEQYGFHNLSSQTVFQADGTEHSYYKLPENYPLEIASPEPVFDVYDDNMNGCSNESVLVFTGSPKQLSYEEEQQDSEQILKRVNKGPKTEQTVYLNYLTYVQRQLDDEKTPVHL